MKSNRRLAVVMTGGLVLSVVLGWPAAPAMASDLAQRVAIDSFRGPQGAVVQDAVESALLRQYFLVPDAQVLEAARKSGVRLRSDEDFAEVGRSLNVAAFVTATVKRNKNWRVEMVVRNGETGEAVARYDVTNRHLDGLTANLARSTPRRLQVLLANRSGAGAGVEADAEPDEVRVKARPPARRSRQQDDEAEDADKPAKVTKKAGKAKIDKDKDDAEEETSDEKPRDNASTAIPRPYLELGVGGRVFSRSMTFTDNFSNIPAYRLDRATALTIDMAFHPFAVVDSTRNDWIAGFGVTANVTYAMGITTEQTGDTGRARTEVHGYELGARYRAALGPVDIVPRGAYMAETFAANVGTVAPDVDYRVLKGGLLLQLALSRQAFMRASADYLYVLSAGRLNDADRFPRAITRGVDLSLGAAYAFSDNIEAFVAVGLRRYGYDLKVQPGDSLIAGGALDEYVSMTMGLTYRPSMGGN